MDISTTIVGLVLLLLGVVPFVLIRLSIKRKLNKTRLAFQEIAKSKNLNLAICDVNDHVFIGIDKDKSALFYQYQEEGSAASEISIKQIKSCQYTENVRVAGSNHRNDRFIEQIALDLHFHSGSKPIKLEFFSSRNGLLPNGEKEFCEKWAGIISSEIEKTAV